jgi:thiamine biosynthesis lipoprotein
MISREFRSMGCQMAVHLDTDEDRARILGAVPGWFEEWEQSLSRFRGDSELSLVNRNPGMWQHVSDNFWQVFELALEIYSFSDGLVTPAVLPALEHAGYEVSFEPGGTFSGKSTHPAALEVPDFLDIQFSPTRQEIRLPEGMRLDFGGIAKGWSAHQAMLRLAAYGPVLVNAGGDISVSGPRINGTPWKVGIIDPLQPERDIVHVSLASGGLATSGKDYRAWRQNGILRHHIIDPRTGSPAMTEILTSSVIAATIMEAEAAAKVLFIHGLDDGDTWLAEHPNLAALQVTDDGCLRATKTMQRNFWRENDSANRSN